MLYHYTVLSKVRMIVADRRIKPSMAGAPFHHKPAVWFSRRTDWEPTADKMVWDGERKRRATAEEMDGMVRCRIVVDDHAAPITWRGFRKTSGIPKNFAKALYDIAIENDSDPHDWRVSLEPVTDAQWLAVEVSVDGVWRPLYRKSTAASRYEPLECGSGSPGGGDV